MLPFFANELIFEIIRHFLPGIQLSLTEPQLFPWYLGQISSAWRSTFISTPQFWTRLHIDTDVYLKERLPNLDNVFELLQMALKRSNSQPLTLSVTMNRLLRRNPKPDDTIVASRCKDILELLVSHSVCWRDLCMELDALLYPTLYGAKGRLPILRSMKDINSIHRDVGKSFQDTFTDSPQLTRIMICTLGRSYWTFNQSPLTVIHIIKIWSMDDIIHVLQQTSALEELVIGNIVVFRDINVLDVSHFHLPLLKKLCFPTPIYLPLFRTPRLEELYLGDIHKIQNLHFTTENIEASISDYFSTVHNLRKLAAYLIDINDEFPIFKGVPSHIRDLSLHGARISGQLRLAEDCRELYNLETISIKTWEYQIPDVLKTVENWGGTEGGLGPFKNLGQFSLDCLKDSGGVFAIARPEIGDPLAIVERLKKVVEGQGIRFVSRIIVGSTVSTLVHGTWMPPFEIL